MSFIISNKATKRQLEILAELEYYGTGKYAGANLSAEEAGRLIDELFTQKKMTTGQIREIAADYYNLPIVDNFQHQQEDYTDPFAPINKRSKE